MNAGAFSAASRAGEWERLTSERWDALVIGGGATGCGVARELAARGVRTALVEAGDWGGGTSGRSSRLIHGGLRYLQTGDFALVFEALAERRRLLELAPHLVHPLRFLFPVYRGGPVGLRTLQAGMWLYDLLSLFRGIARHRILRPAGCREIEPGLAKQALRGGALYFDAAVDDVRLTLAAARAAWLAGAAMVPRAEVVRFRSAGRHLEGVAVHDRLRGRDAEVHARLVINATGPWSDTLRRLADPDVRPRLRPTKGVHVMLRRERIGSRGALIFASPLDARVMFVLPWRDRVYIGTTDTDYEGAVGDAVAEAADVDYLLGSANGLFPDARLTPADVVSTWAGVRPLLAAERDPQLAAGATSREHEVWRDRSGLLNIAGGKLTTYRVMAVEAADAAAELLRSDGVVVETAPAPAPLPGAPPLPWDAFASAFAERAAGVGLDDEVADHLARAYGTDAEAILRRIADDAALGARLLPDLPYVRAEVPHAVEEEMALTLEDVLARRLHLFHEAAEGGVDVARAVAELMAPLPGIGWEENRIEVEVAAYAAAVARSRSVVGPADSAT